MTTFNNLDELIAAIHSDISIAKSKLDTDKSRQYLTHSFFQKKS